MFFRRKQNDDVVTAGAVYEREREYNLTEQALVTWVGNDSFGIPHVRFRVTVPGFDEMVDNRVLATEVFQERYRLCRESHAA